MNTLKKPCALITIFLITCAFPCDLALAQGESAVPFLLIGSSVDGNAMGGISATIPSVTATAPIANPAQLGLFSLENVLSAAVYPKKTEWLPEYNFSELTYSASAINVGYNFKDLLPLPVSVGIGYSRIDINLGTFTVTGPSSPTGTRFEAREIAEQFSVGFGLEYLVRVGIGFNSKWIDSRLGPTGTEMEPAAGTAKAFASDFGINVVAPLTDIVSTLSGESLQLLPRVEPLLDVSFGYVHGNVGREIRYVSVAQADPLPRRAVIGLGVELGFAARIRDSRWKIASVVVAREVEDILVLRANDGTFTYQSGLGDIAFTDNVILGKMNSRATVRKGWQVQVGEVLFVRGGRTAGPGLAYYTDGFGVQLNGFLKLLELAAPELSEGWIGFVGEHFDVQYSRSTYGDTRSPIDGTSFGQLNLLVKKLPF